MKTLNLARELNAHAERLIAARSLTNHERIMAQIEAIEAIEVHLGHALSFEQTHTLED